MKQISFYLYIFLTLYSCGTQQNISNLNSVENRFISQGRTAETDAGKQALIGTASYVMFWTESEKIVLEMYNPTSITQYFVVEVEGKYLGRFPIKAGKTFQKEFDLGNATPAKYMKIYKATEAANGELIFVNAFAKEFYSFIPQLKPHIEFIGNSITCGMGNDVEIPCEKGEWTDQHNGYYSYAAVAARKLNVDYTISCVSGM